MPHILILELFKKFQNGKLSPILDSIFIRWDTSHILFSDNMIFLQIIEIALNALFAKYARFYAFRIIYLYFFV